MIDECTLTWRLASFDGGGDDEVGLGIPRSLQEEAAVLRSSLASAVATAAAAAAAATESCWLVGESLVCLKSSPDSFQKWQMDYM